MSVARQVRQYAIDQDAAFPNADVSGDTVSTDSHLRVIEGTKGHLRQALVPVLIAAVVLFLATVVLPLVLNTAMASLSYEIRDLRIETASTQARIETLEARLLAANSTDHLRSEAERIGLVPAGPIGVISIDSGTVDGGVAAK